MGSFHDSMIEYRNELKKGVIQKAYKCLMEYIMGLRTHFSTKYPESLGSGSVYTGYMDMTYFPLVSKSLKQRGLKIAVVFLHEACRFEVWLAGVNKQVQTQYWQLFKESDWNLYPLVPTIKGADSILEHIVVADPDFNDLDSLTNQIESGTMQFISDVEGFLVNQPK